MALKKADIGCNVDVPVLALGGADRVDESKDLDTTREDKPDFDDLWNFLEKSQPLDTSDLLPFEGVEERLIKQIKENNRLLEEMEILRNSVPTLAWLGLSGGFLFARAYL